MVLSRRVVNDKQTMRGFVVDSTIDAALLLTV